MENQYTISHFLETIANTNLLLKEQISKIQSDILSFDEFIVEHQQSKRELSLLKGFAHDIGSVE
jgi:prefoldin subunit 5